MSILSMVQRIAADAGFQQPTYVVGNPDEIAIQLLAHIERETRRLSDEFFWQKLVTIYNFNFVVNQESYDLPSDYNYILPNTIWNKSGRQPIICPITPEDYGLQKNYLVTSAYYKMAYVYNNLMYITPVPAGGTTTQLSPNPLTTTTGSNTVLVTVNSTEFFFTGQNVTIIGAEDTGGLLASQLNISATITIIDAFTFSYDVSGAPATSDTVGGGVGVSISAMDVVTYQYVSNKIYKSATGVGQTTILADTDTTVIKEFIVELGAKLRFLVAKGLITPAEMESSYEKKDYDFQIKRQMMIDGIGQKTLQMRSGNSAYWLAAYTQDSNWPQV